MILIVGGNGFVGSAYCRLFERRGIPFQVVTRANARELAGTPCDVLINANGNSKKFLADREPLNEFDASVRSVAETIELFKPDYYVHLSTGDVYPDTTSPAATSEDQVIDPARLSRYGLHKYMAEMLVRGTQKSWLIVRMGGFVGPGLKKNAIFDMMHGDPVWLAPESELQFIHTDHAAAAIWSAVEKRPPNQIVNLGGQGTVHLGELHARMGSRSQFKDDARRVVYELDVSRLAALSGPPLPRSADDVLAYVDAAAAQQRD
jgi:nucleoside-diphosphate-sugar epimerase